MISWWLQTCPRRMLLRFASRAFAMKRQACELLQQEKTSLCSNRSWFGYRIKHPECYGYVYLWYDRKQRKLCIGSHHKRSRSTSAWDGYLTSTGRCKKEIEERPYDFRFRVLEYNLENDCRKRTQALEQKWLNKIPENQLESQRNTRYYNQCRFAGGGSAMSSSVAAKISAAQKKAVANGTHNFIHSHPSKDPIAEEKRKATIAKAVANRTHHLIHKNPMKDPATKEKWRATVAKAVVDGTHHFVNNHPLKDPVIREKWKATVAKAVADGTHHFIRNHPLKNPIGKERRRVTVARTVANGTHHFVHSNPMNNPAIKEKAIAKMKMAAANAVAKGTHHFLHSHPMKDPEVKARAIAKRKIVIANAITNGTHNFIRNNPMKNPEVKAKKKVTVEEKKRQQLLGLDKIRTSK